MTAIPKNAFKPRYQGRKWLKLHLPEELACWKDGRKASIGKDRSDHLSLDTALQRTLSCCDWRWPKRPVYFVADPHADVEAFICSLVATGGVQATGPGIRDFKLTRQGKKGRFIIGGDCLDKGPSSLQMLEGLRHLLNSKAEVILLAGNHDLRLLMGIGILDKPRDTRTEHFFLRMGPKIVPLLKEVNDRYLHKRSALRGIPDAKECRRRLYPSKQWFKAFPSLAQWLMPDQTVARELERMEKKLDRFEKVCEAQGMSMRRVYAAALKCRELFLQPGGRYYWFFRSMQLLHREGSFLFVHAGIDDRIAALIDRNDLAYVNRQYRRQVLDDPFEFYYGPLANALRTKYRPVDMPLSGHGVGRMLRQGFHVVVHGHRNRTEGQRIMLRQGLLHIECDTTMDRNSRKSEGLSGFGAGATLIHPKGQVIGISSDYPRVKLFVPARMKT
jgi:hypothetical protein